MKKLVFYSDQVIPKNKKVDLALLRLIGRDKPRIGYIPSQSDPQRKYFQEKVEYYRQYRIEDLLYFDLDQEYDESKTGKLLACDAIHLSGGNTYYFLNSIKKRKFAPILKEFVRKGGVLVGVSAGGYMMTSSIKITSLFSENENSVGLKNFTALGLVDFEFCPHFNQKEKYLEKIKEYSKSSGKMIHACRDGDGIVVYEDKVKLIGKVVNIKQGRILRSA